MSEKLLSDRRALTDLAARLSERAANLATAEKARADAATADPDSTARKNADADADWSKAQLEYAEAARQVNSAEALVRQSQTDLDGAQKGLALANARQTAAANDVDAVVKPAIDDVIAQRKQVVLDTETAVKIVGGSGS